jgi:prevent-host-death family protein
MSRTAPGAQLSQPQHVRQSKTRGISCALLPIMAAAGGTPALRPIWAARPQDAPGGTKSSECPCASVKSVYFVLVQATLTELRRDTSRVVRAADNGEEVILTEHGEPRYKLQRVQAIDRKAAAAALRAIGPVTFLPRK